MRIILILISSLRNLCVSLRLCCESALKPQRRSETQRWRREIVLGLPNAIFGETIGGFVSGDALRVGVLENRQNRVVDLIYFL